MTIGIAAYGRDAGLAVLRALAAVEAVGRGAIGGFVSMVAISSAGVLVRAETQRGGSARLFEGGLASAPGALLEAGIAGLMSSGPDRPEPLSQFTPALADVGLVTGHRMPNTMGAGGLNLNDEVLDLLRRGIGVDEAVQRVLAANPGSDAGVIALSIHGEVCAADSAHVERRGDRGRALLRAAGGDAVVAVLHNSIHPVRPLAQLAAEVALDVMLPADRADGRIRLRSGTPLRLGPANAVEIAPDGMVETVLVEDPRFLDGGWSLGLGHETAVLGAGRLMGAMLYEPYLVVQDGLVKTLDGRDDIFIPIRVSADRAPPGRL
ncbi:hypothetical protein SAMN02745157_4533 [Kaistia soli DSM 19436]|uniref:Uncharacterized protein n=1 Tax=Kaistia soli DSM 19436 TaxID=1122133 RepID=A0A1M5LAE8_9HYPH|nr:hypothetical protein [Kaistia soli]SHG61689.1 hypothetical protein SAMN02745157_4533 [Kaistia soli DSM 19436]